MLFAAVYAVLVYSAAPNRHVSNELFICSARATAASIWVLSATSWALPLAPLQVAIALFSRLGDASASGESAARDYESVPLNGACTPNVGIDSDVEAPDLDPDGIKMALQQRLHHDGNQLTFNFGGSGGVSVAAIAARESGTG